MKVPKGLFVHLMLALVFVGASSSPLTSAPKLAQAVVSKRARSFSLAQRQAIANAVTDSARRYGLSEALILAVIQIESSFLKRRRSVRGALGLMQVMPSTGREWARRLKIRWRGRRTLFAPAQNIRIGSAYLAWLLRRFQGDEKLALTAYCHGPITVRRALRTKTLTRRRLRYARKIHRARKRLLRAQPGAFRAAAPRLAPPSRARAFAARP